MKLLERCKKAEILGDEGQTLCMVPVEWDALGVLMVTVAEEFDEDAAEIFTLRFYDPDQGLLTCKCRLFYQKKMPRHTKWLRCEVVEQLSREQRRRDLKVPLEDTKVLLRVLGAPAQEVKSSVINISAGGVYLSTTLRAEKGDRFFFTFNEAGKPIPLVAEILRVVEPEDGNPAGPFGYGCQFMEMSLQQEEILRGFIFRKDMEARRRR